MLLDRVRTSVLGCTATMVRAPGGAGKTALARAVVDDLDVPWAWVTLDEWDDLSRVLELLHLALTRLGVELPELGQLLLGTATPWSTREATSLIVNGVLDAGVGQVVVVLDDVHVLEGEPDAVELLADLVAVAPPALHLLLTTRRPLPAQMARLETGGRLVQIGPERLRVRREQAARILQKLGTAADDEAVDRLVERTGGWITGIRLEASHPDHDGHTTFDLVRRFVEEELLAELSANDARALIDLAVLHRIRPGDVAAVTGRRDGMRWLDAMVDQLPVLVGRLDDETVQFHELLREALLRVLASDPDRLRRLHTAAADIVDDWQEQLHHLFAGEAFEQAADLLERRSRAVFSQAVPLLQVRASLDRLPRAEREGRPWLRVVEGVALAHLSEHAAARQTLRSVACDIDDEDVLARWAAERYLQRVGDDLPARTQRLRAMETEPGFGDLPPALHAEHHLSVAHGSALAGRWDEVPGRHDAAIHVVVASGDVAAAEVVSLNTSPFLAVADGGVERIEGYVDWLGRRLEDASPLLVAAQQVHRVLVAFLRGDLGAAEVHSAAAGELPVRLHAPYLQAQLDWARVCASAVRDDLAPAADLLESRRRANAPYAVPDQLAVSWLAPLARLRRAQGRLDDLRALVRGAHEVTAIVGPEAAFAESFVAVARAQLAAAEGRAGDAVAILETAVRGLDATRVVPAVGRLQLDLVVALADARRPDDALRLLRDELALLERLHAVGLVAATGVGLVPVLDRAIDAGIQVRAARSARAVLAADAPPAAVTLQRTGATLSSREVEVLRLLAAGRSNAEIADELVLSVNTIKTHVGNVLRKLGVPTRAAAAGTAHEVGIGGGGRAARAADGGRGSPV